MNLEVNRLCEKIYEFDNQGIDKITVTIDKAVAIADYIAKLQMNVHTLRISNAKLKHDNASLVYKALMN